MIQPPLFLSLASLHFNSYTMAEAQHTSDRPSDHPPSHALTHTISRSPSRCSSLYNAPLLGGGADTGGVHVPVDLPSRSMESSKALGHVRTSLAPTPTPSRRGGEYVYLPSPTPRPTPGYVPIRISQPDADPGPRRGGLGLLRR